MWESVESLADFVFRSAHTEVMRQRRQWFDPMPEAYTVLWWIPAGHIPTIEESEERLDLLRKAGPSPEAFTLRQPYDPPQSSEPADLRSANQPASSAEHSSSSTPATTSGR